MGCINSRPNESSFIARWDSLSASSGDSNSSDWDVSSTLAYGTPLGTVREMNCSTSLPPVSTPRQLSRTPFKAPQSSQKIVIVRAAGLTFLNEYLIIKYLGKGTSGRVFLCMDVNGGGLYAMKVIRRDVASHALSLKYNKFPLEELHREIYALKMADHQCIVSLKAVIEDQGVGKIVLVMGWAEGGAAISRDQLERGDRLSEEIARLYFRDMVRGLHHLHSKHIIHGDLKPENALMCASGHLVLSDFGCSKDLKGGDEPLNKSNGTPAFLAPEMTLPHARYRGRPADTYALGVCLHIFIFGKVPFTAQTVAELFHIVQTQPLHFPEEPKIPEELRDLLAKMLTKSPKDRITLAEISSHPWVTAMGKYTLQLKDGAVDDLRAEKWLAGMINPGMEVISFPAGASLLNKGHKLGTLLYIVHGECNVIYRLVDDQADCLKEEESGSHMVDVDADNSEDMQIQGSEMLHRDMQPDLDNDSYLITPGRTHRETCRTHREFPEFLTEAIKSAKTVARELHQTSNEYILGKRGPGDFLGEVELFGGGIHNYSRHASIVCTKEMWLIVIPRQDAKEYLARHPLAKQQMAEIVWQRQSEIIKVEAYSRLAGLHLDT